MKKSGMGKRALMLAIAAIWITTGSGCARTELRYVAQPLPLPVRPLLPKLTEQDLMPLDDTAYYKIWTRDRMRREYCEELEAIIRSTHEGEDLGRD